MKEMFLPLFDWMAELSIGKAISDSSYAFAVIEIFHLFGIVLLLGGTSLMALRLVGLGLKQQKVSYLAQQTGGYILAGLVLMLVSGLLMLISIPNKYYHSVPFWWKMAFFWPGIIFHFTLYRKVTRSESPGFLLGALTALLTVVVWYSTLAFGRAIGFY